MALKIIIKKTGQSFGELLNWKENNYIYWV